MNMREKREKIERTILSSYASLSEKSKGRMQPEEQCSIRTDYQRDRDRILHSKSFRRLKHKTQVFIAAEGDHYRTRLTHTLEVSQISRTVARALDLNEDLAEAIALGHDLGHTPFGHAGEEVLAKLVPGGFKHNEQSLRVVNLLEDGHGMNLTFEVRDGILNHTGPNDPVTLEGRIVKICDRIAYINHDIDDAIRAGVLSIADIDKKFTDSLGADHRTRINTLVLDLINASEGNDSIHLSRDIGEVMNDLRDFLFTHVYYNPIAKSEEQTAKHILEELFSYYIKNQAFIGGWNHGNSFSTHEQHVADYIAGMTDNFAIAQYYKFFRKEDTHFMTFLEALSEIGKERMHGFC